MQITTTRWSTVKSWRTFLIQIFYWKIASRLWNKPGGIILVTTINRTLFSFFVNFIIAVWIATIIPRGSHSWFWSRKPKEIENIFLKYNCHKIDTAGWIQISLPWLSEQIHILQASIGTIWYVDYEKFIKIMLLDIFNFNKQWSAKCIERVKISESVSRTK